ncbi:3-oxoacyl-[acyl-carrier-protein] reductase [Metarhizobium album]|uniref:3-oxoacyl-[acyl-carrier-protein] reductase n=1 Tax=Metarhizobium album TaxID=2182425 RepID=A0A2U2DQT2_9HYPH|nr:SDR family NAD(P)-dependent oxidoreductase [Rhizobium album]PWE55670.1 3-oxoacyl-[acyl-carrier-protein] reductase [Rhizobium album]
MRLTGKVALVTGGGSGIGKATALALASEGAKLGVLSRTTADIEQTCAEIGHLGGEGLPITADIADEAEMSAAIESLVARFGRLDIIVANAGINGVWAPIDDLRPAEWDKTISVNLRGTYLTLHYGVPHLKAAGGGSIIVVSSINGTRTFSTPGATAYTATKAAQVAMVQQLALELGKFRIRVNAVCPGLIETNIPESTSQRGQRETEIPVVWPEGDIPITRGEAGRSEDVADVVAFLACDASRHVTGSPIWVDGGQGLLR